MTSFTITIETTGRVGLLNGLQPNQLLNVEDNRSNIMPFEQATTMQRVPTRVEVLTVTLQYSYQTTTPEPTEQVPNPQPVEALVTSAKFAIQVVDQDGATVENWRRTGQLEPHLTAGQKTALTGFMDALWSKAQDVISH